MSELCTMKEVTGFAPGLTGTVVRITNPYLPSDAQHVDQDLRQAVFAVVVPEASKHGRHVEIIPGRPEDAQAGGFLDSVGQQHGVSPRTGYYVIYGPEVVTKPGGVGLQRKNGAVVTSIVAYTKVEVIGTIASLLPDLDTKK